MNRKGWSHLIEKDQYSQGKQNEEQPKSISIRFLAYGVVKETICSFFFFLPRIEFDQKGFSLLYCHKAASTFLNKNRINLETLDTYVKHRFWHLVVIINLHRKAQAGAHRLGPV